MKIKVIWFVLMIALGFTINKAQNATSVFNQNWLKTIVSIEILMNGKYFPIGTGFIVTTPQKHVALVTAKHVILNEYNNVTQNIYYRLNEIKGKSNIIPATYPPKYVENLGWFFSKEYDLACRFIQYLETSDIIEIDTSQYLFSNQLDPGANVLVLGFPLGLRSEEYSNPLIRRGIIAKTDSNVIIIDAFVFPGNSGGPVLYTPPIKFGKGLISGLINEEKIIGVVSSYIPYDDVAISNQTKRPRIIFEENSGLCNVIPIDALDKLLNSKEFQLIDQNLYKFR